VLINESTARQLFGGVDVVGRTFDERGFDGAKVRRVVGVVGDTRVWDLREPPPAFVYRPSADYYSDWFYIVARSRAPQAQVEGIVIEAMQRLDPAIPFFRAQPLAQMLRHAIGAELMFARMSGVLGILAALLAAIGLYGLMGYSVEQRRREIGIRMALGARMSRVIGLVTGETLQLALAGVLVGCIGGWALSRVLQHLLYGVGVLNVSAYALAALAFAAIALLAAAVPARSAARVQPATTLRQE
jgi:ABC-type antimicrobial peptide transport system permease subunit